MVDGYQKDLTRHELDAALRDYRGSGTPLKRVQLPKAFRVALVDHQGVGVALTDETQGADDPPLLFASSDSGKVSVAAASYLGWVVDRLLDHIHRHATPADATLVEKLARRRK
jgi:hypothetical protein